MDINHIYSHQRIGQTEPTHQNEIRTQFQRDFDRIIFSSAFRRLQNKTQVFPLPGSVFVHNRLTHSLEVASVGRSLGTMIGDFLLDHSAKYALNEPSKNFYKNSLHDVIAAACLCHDIGNPAFGHSGEDAIASYFIKNESQLKRKFSDEEWSDFINFEGNANAIRILTQQQNGKSEGGLLLTYATMAAIAKYPCESIAKDKNILQRKKFGFFQTEKEAFKTIAQKTQMIQNQDNPLAFSRHPFVWLVEAADDICYHIIDLEDAHRLGFVPHEVVLELLRQLLLELDVDNQTALDKRLDSIADKNDKIAYLRAKSIGALTLQSKNKYCQQFENILEGSLKIALFDQIMQDCPALQRIQDFSIENIYNHRSVLEIENAGYHVMYKLLDHFISSIILEKGKRRKSDEKALLLMPLQFHYPDKSIYEQVLGVLDYLSGMTDNYATDLYKKIQGIDIGMTV